MGHSVQTAEQFVLCSNVAVRTPARVCRLRGCSVSIEPQTPLKHNDFAFIPVLWLCSLERNIVGL